MASRRLSIAVGAALAIVLIAPGAAGAATITVDTIADNTLNDGDCTLREAITNANNNSQLNLMGGECIAGQAFPTRDTINFAAAIVDDPDAPDRTINLGAFLPDIGEVATIDGCALATSPASGPCVDVHGQNTATVIMGSIQANDVLIRRLAFGNAQLALGLSTGFTGLTIQGDWFGLKLDGTADPVANGVGVTGDSSTIGGASPGQGNVFANATDTALTVNGNNNQILGNLIGVKADGTAAAGNGTAIAVLGPNSGIHATGNVIGGAQPTPGSCTGPCNVIANSGGSAILLQTTNRLAEDTTISGNFVGLNQSGSLAANGPTAINNNNAIDTTIGGGAAGERNYISGGGNGVFAAAQGAPGLVVRNNFIGVSPAGTASLGPPTSDGIFFSSVASSPALITGNRIAVASTAWAIQGINFDAPITTGATISDNITGLGTGGQDFSSGDAGIRASNLDRATISGNTLTNFDFAGISLEATDDASVTGNRFNVDPTGAGDHSDPGGSHGILLDDNPSSDPASGNTIGGTTATSENLISNIPGSAIVIRHSDNDDNTIGRNRGANNTGIFIDLGEDGVGNTNIDAPNHGIGAPIITSATDDLVAGNGASAGATVLIFRTPDGGDPKNLTSFVAQATASGIGAWQAPVNIPNGTRVTALQTDASGDSSELSASKAAVADPPETTITAGPKKRTRLKGHAKRKKVTFTFTSSEPGEGGFQCQIDVKPFVLCDGGSFTRKLKKGKHTFRVRAYDDASNPDPTLAIRTFRIVRKRPH